MLQTQFLLLISRDKNKSLKWDVFVLFGVGTETKDRKQVAVVEKLFWLVGTIPRNKSEVGSTVTLFFSTGPHWWIHCDLISSLLIGALGCNRIFFLKCDSWISLFINHSSTLKVLGLYIYVFLGRINFQNVYNESTKNINLAQIFLAIVL